MIRTSQFLNSYRGKRLPVWFRSHEVFRRYPYIWKAFPLVGLPNMEDHTIHDFNNDMSGKQKLRIVFSSDGVNGLWDLATMSMRGAMSCMHWDNRHSTHMVGTVVCPFTGVIYLTNDERTKWGKAIIKRSLVRMWVDQNGGMSLYLDRVYTKSCNTDPNTYHNRELDGGAKVMRLFATWLRTKTQVPIQYPCRFVGGERIPQLGITTDTIGQYQTMVDSGPCVSRLSTAVEARLLADLKVPKSVLTPLT